MSTSRYGIIGYPLAHSMSPTLHNWAFRQAGIDAVYEAFPTSPEELRSFVDRVRSEPLLGVSVTIPHKQTIMDMLDEVTDRAAAVGAVNTLHWKDGKLCGENTDVIGVIAPLGQLDHIPLSAVVVGAGGASRAAVAGLKEWNVGRIVVTNRHRDRAEIIGRDFGVEVLDWEGRHKIHPELLINTTPLGMTGTYIGRSPWSADALTPTTTVYDTVYNPLRTKLIRDAEAHGCRTISGLEMFLHQGLAQFELWTDVRPDEEAARTMLREALAEG